MTSRLYSLILGRPTMACADTFDVKLVPGTLHGDGTPNPYVHFQQSFISLTQLTEEVINKVCYAILALLQHPF